MRWWFCGGEETGGGEEGGPFLCWIWREVILFKVVYARVRVVSMDAFWRVGLGLFWCLRREGAQRWGSVSNSTMLCSLCLRTLCEIFQVSLGLKLELIIVFSRILTFVRIVLGFGFMIYFSYFAEYFIGWFKE